VTFLTFPQRLKPALAHEQNVLAWLKQRGIKAFPFGQGLLAPECRDLLKRFSSPVRWMPDIVFFISQQCHGYVDAKTGRLDTFNHSIEINALQAAKLWTAFAGATGYFFVWENGETASLQSVLANLEIPGNYRGGSGTPFALLPRRICLPFDVVFGNLAAVAARRAPVRPRGPVEPERD
jgi:hypothetical protein